MGLSAFVSNCCFNLIAFTPEKNGDYGLSSMLDDLNNLGIEKNAVNESV